MKKRPSRTAHFSVFYSCGEFNTPMLASGLLICFFYKMNMIVGSLHYLYGGLAAEIENIGFNRFWRLLSAGVLAEPFHFIEIFYGSFVD